MKHVQNAKPGARLAGYNVLAEIGRGAASIIYLVQDPKTKQIWALKHVIKGGPKDQRFLDQAEQEATVASKLDHPTMRKIEKCIKNRALLNVKELFLVMEYVDGVSIEKHSPETVQEMVDIFRQVARGLQHMHERGFVHADMKPNNIVVCDDGSVKVIDLGQSCAAGTVKERIQGTPDYIAPEQVHLRPITEKTDIYNLGATMYWTLTRRHIPTAIPRDENSLLGALDDSLIERPTPVRELAPETPEMLADLIMMSVEVDLDKRPATMEAVADRLDLIQAKMLADRRANAKGERLPGMPDPDEDDGPAGADLDIDDVFREDDSRRRGAAS